MKRTVSLLAIFLFILSAKGQMEKSNIPPELKDFKGKKVYLETLDVPGFEHHDPSNIIRHNDKFYMWYTEHPKNTRGWNGGYIRCATSRDGYKWEDQGVAIYKGDYGTIDDKAAITAYVVPHDEKFYLFYSALGSLGKYPGITYAVADTPDGPWEKSGKKVIWPSGDMKDWDGTHSDDTNIVFFFFFWFLYYKARPQSSIHLRKKTVPTQIGVAISDQLVGPYKKYEGNPIFPGHAFSAWIHRNGVAAMGYGTFWSEDGIHFVKASDWHTRSCGLYCPENFGTGENYRGVSWGLDVGKRGRNISRHIFRIELPLLIKGTNP